MPCIPPAKVVLWLPGIAGIYFGQQIAARRGQLNRAVRTCPSARFPFPTRGTGQLPAACRTFLFHPPAMSSFEQPTGDSLGLNRIVEPVLIYILSRSATRAAE